VEQLQSVSCDLYGDEGHSYQECPLAQPDEGAQQVNSVNNEPPFMTNPPYKPYPKESPEFQKWVHGRQGSGNYSNYNQNFYQNNQRNRQFQQSLGNGSRNFYQNTYFPNQGNKPQFNQQRPPYVAPAVTEFMKGQEKMNQVMLEQMQAISA
jgi:hypothetical protein